jgi:hypothetical protein
MNKRIAKALKSIANRMGYAVLNARHAYVEDGIHTRHNGNFRRDPAFRDAYARGVQASGGFDPKMEWRVHVALWAASLAARRRGDFVECGVNAGFISSAIMHFLDWKSSARAFYLIDTFSGPVLSQFSRQEIVRGRDKIAKSALAGGAYVTDLARVRANFSEWPGAVVVQGTVPDVLATVEFGDVAFLHLDMNCALPESAALEFFWSRLVPGAIVLLDDYAYAGHESQGEAIDAVAGRLGGGILALPTGQGLMVKGDEER